MGDKRKIYNNNCGNAYKDLKLREKLKWKILALNQTNNHIQKHKCREKSKIFTFYNTHLLPVPSVIKHLTMELKSYSLS
jgi:hypothetical protein